MNALVLKTDSQKNKSYFWIYGASKRDCWRQLDDLQEHSTFCKLKNYFDIVILEDNGIAIDVYDRKVVPPDYIKDLMSGAFDNMK